MENGVRRRRREEEEGEEERTLLLLHTSDKPDKGHLVRAVRSSNRKSSSEDSTINTLCLFKLLKMIVSDSFSDNSECVCRSHTAAAV